MLKYVNIILAICSRLFIFAGLILGYLSKKKMGVLRSMMYRNDKLIKTVFSPVLQYIYIGLMIALILWAAYLVLEKKKTLKQVYWTCSLGIIASLAVYYVTQVSLVALPLVTLGLIIGVGDSVVSMIRSE